MSNLIQRLSPVNTNQYYDGGDDVHDLLYLTPHEFKE